MKMLSASGTRLVLSVGLVLIALLINTLFFTHASNKREAEARQKREQTEAVLNEQRVTEAAKKENEEKESAKKAAEVAQAEAEKKAVQEAVDRRASYLARYLNPGFESKPDLATIGVAIASEDGVANLEVADALCLHFNTNGVRLLSAYFKPEFVADGMVAAIFKGQTEMFGKLELTNSLDAVLIGRQFAEYSDNPSLENTITANLQLELVVFPIRTVQTANSWKFVAKGIGFTRHEARKLAEERIINQISSDTKMTLARVASRQ